MACEFSEPEEQHYDKSAARAEMSARSLVVLKHPRRLREPNTPELSQIVTVERSSDPDTPARSWSDYRVTTKDTEVPEGVDVIEKISCETQA